VADGEVIWNLPPGQPTADQLALAAQAVRDCVAALRASGEPVAALWASEPGLYGRFGYGVASRKAVVSVPRPIRASRASTAPMRVVLGDVADRLDDCIDLYERVRPHRPGMVSRSPQAWAESSFDEPESRSGASVLRCARVIDPDGRTHGYAWFRTRPDWRGGSPQGTVTVAEMLSSTPHAARALYDLVFDLDLMASTEVWNVPLDHPLLLWSHSRRLRPAIDEQLWVRLLRLDEALAARTYAVPVDVVIDVSDDLFADNAGRWRLAGNESGATMIRTSAPADVVLDVRDLAGGYLGDDHLDRAVVAGLVTERTTGAAGRLARAKRGDRAPWCTCMF
jgi:predicted acetyltransferase